MTLSLSASSPPQSFFPILLINLVHKVKLVLLYQYLVSFAPSFGQSNLISNCNSNLLVFTEKTLWAFLDSLAFFTPFNHEHLQVCGGTSQSQGGNVRSFLWPCQSNRRICQTSSLVPVASWEKGESRQSPHQQAEQENPPAPLLWAKQRPCP